MEGKVLPEATVGQTLALPPACLSDIGQMTALSVLQFSYMENVDDNNRSYAVDL